MLRADDFDLGGLHSPIEAVLNHRVNNETLAKSRLTQTGFDDRRDVDKDCGYPKTSAITIENYKHYYDRLSIAARVVEIWPYESWLVQPTVFETDDLEEETEFEKGWNELEQMINPNSWFDSKEKNSIWDYLRRIDVLSGIGHFGILLLGVDDGKPLDEPLESRKGQRLLFLRSLDESLVTISSYEDNTTDPRYGQPILYSVTFSGTDNDSKHSTPSTTTHLIHWTRIIHIADNRSSSELFGTPRMRPVWNHLYDLKKLYGGSAEMYWQGALPGISLETHPQLGGDVETDEDAIKDMMEQYSTRLQRYLSLSGMSAKSLAPQVVDPKGHIDSQIEAICILGGYPKRIFMGSERGELSSSQDSITWNNRVASRQNGYVTSQIIVPFINRLILMGILPEPISYNIVWPDLNNLSEEAMADVAVKRTEALAKYVQGGVDALISPVDYLTAILGMTVDEATEIVDEKVDELLNSFGREEEDVNFSQDKTKQAQGRDNQ